MKDGLEEELLFQLWGSFFVGVHVSFCVRGTNLYDALYVCFLIAPGNTP